MEAPAIFKAFQKNNSVEEHQVLNTLHNHQKLIYECEHKAHTTLRSVEDINYQLQHGLNPNSMSKLHRTIHDEVGDGKEVLKFDKLVNNSIVRGYTEPELGDVMFEVVTPKTPDEIRPVPVLKPATMSAMVKENTKLIKDLKTFKSYEPTISKLRNDFDDICKKVIREERLLDKDTLQKVGVQLNYIKHILKLQMKQSVKLFAVIPKLTTDVVQHSQDYCKMSLRYYK